MVLGNQNDRKYIVEFIGSMPSEDRNIYAEGIFNFYEVKYSSMWKTYFG